MPDRRWWLAIVIAVATAAAGCRGRPAATRRAAAVRSRPTSRLPVPPRLRVPRAGTPPALDGELAEPDWPRAARTGAFVDEARGGPARPFSEAKLLWDDHHLYLGLYAADEDIRTPRGSPQAPDLFAVRLRTPAGERFDFAFAPTGLVRETRTRADGTPVPGWQSHLRAGVDLDGTPDHPEDFDEEWVVEAAIPFAALGLTAEPGATLGAAFSRCDTPKGSDRRCAAWGEAADGRERGVIELAGPGPTPPTPPPGTR